jgi:tartrate-resistant acid phosphatase type 5
VWVGLLVPAVVCSQTPPAPALIDSLRQVSLLALGRGLRDRDTVFARVAVTAANPKERMMAANSLGDSPQSESWLLGYFVQERDPRALWVPLSNLSYSPSAWHDPRARIVLQYLLETSTDSAVMTNAVEALRSLAMRELEMAVTARLLEAKRQGNDSLVHALAATEDRAIMLERGIMLPTFLRRAPPPFAVATTSRHRIRVLAFGDFGALMSPDEIATARAMVIYQRTHPYDFGLTLGDNFYVLGLSSPDNPRWVSEYEKLYGPLGITLYASFGNHDEFDPDSPPAEILYAARSTSWRFPAQFYTFTAGPVQFYAIDTNDPSEVELSWLEQALDASSARWKVVYGHHPLYGSGADYPEGHYVDAALVRKLLPILSGRADVYLAGHLHSLTHMAAVNGVNFFISGMGGAGGFAVGAADSVTRFVTKEFGFAVLEATDATFTVRFVDEHDQQLYTATLRK